MPGNPPPHRVAALAAISRGSLIVGPAIKTTNFAVTSAPIGYVVASKPPTSCTPPRRSPLPYPRGVGRGGAAEHIATQLSVSASSRKTTSFVVTSETTNFARSLTSQRPPTRFVKGRFIEQHKRPSAWGMSVGDTVSPAFNPDVANRDTSAACRACSAYSRDCENWDTSAASRTCPAFSQEVANRYTPAASRACPAYNQDGENWDTPAASRTCSAFNRDARTWDTSAVPAASNRISDIDVRHRGQ